MPRARAFLSELVRRRVIQTVIAYAAVVWVGVEVAATLIPVFGGSDTLVRITVGLIIAGLPVAIAVSWFFDLHPTGFQRDEGPVAGSEAGAQPSVGSREWAIARAARTPVSRHSVAVLPFVDMSAERDQAYLGDGVAEEILNALVKNTPLNISGRTSSFAFANGDLTATEIGAALGVAHVLTGSVRKHADQVRITAALIQVDDGFHAWADTYTGAVSDVFDLQDRIARSIVEELEVVLHMDQARLVATMTRSPEAYDAFLKGRRLVQVQDGDGVLARAVGHLEEAVALDPEFALAWAWLANANFFLPEHNEVPDWKAHLDAGKKAAREAYRLGPELSDANLAMSYAHLLDLDIPAQWEARKRAHDLDPSSVPALHEIGAAYALMGLIEEALPYIEEASTDDPFSPTWTGMLGVLQWLLGDTDKASASFDRTVELGFPLVIGSKGAMLVSMGQRARARAYMLKNFGRHVGDLPKQLRPWLPRYLFTNAITRTSSWARNLIWLDMKGRVGNPKYMPDLSFKATLSMLGEAEAFFQEVRNRPNPYLSGSLVTLWYPSEGGRAIRMHADFPKFAEDIGLVRAWQIHGWPPQIQPLPGTDGSNLQFTCA